MSGPVDVVLLLTSFAIGGTERQMVELAKRLDPSRFRAHVAFPPKRRLLDDMLSRIPSASSCAWLRQPGRGRPVIAFAKWLIDQPGDRPHLDHEHLRPARRGAGRKPRPHRQPPRDCHRRQVARAALAQRLAYRAAHVVVANSSAARDQLEREGVPADRPRLIANGLDAGRFVPASRGGPSATSSWSPTCAPRRATTRCSRRRRASCDTPTPASRSSATGRGGKRSRRRRAPWASPSASASWARGATSRRSWPGTTVRALSRSEAFLP